VSARRRGSLVFGIALCAIAGAIALAPILPVGFFVRGWPLLLVVAGFVSLVRFAAYRRPASPALGSVLVLAGGLGLAFSSTGSSNPFALYGRWWPLFIAVLAIVEVLRFYSAPTAIEGRLPIITKGKLVIVAFVALSGMAAQRVASLDPNALARLELPLVSTLRDGFFGREFTFPALEETAALESGGTVQISNRFGRVRIEAGSAGRVDVSLAATVRAYDQAAADKVFQSLALKVITTPTGVTVATNREDIARQIATNLVIRVPAGASIRAVNEHGDIIVSGLAPGEAGLKLETSYGNVDVRDVTGTIEVRNHHGEVNLERNVGSLTIEGGYTDVGLSAHTGPIVLTGVDDVRISDVTAPSIRLLDIQRANLRISNVRASGAPGRGDGSELAVVEIGAERTEISLERIVGNVTVRTTHGDVSASDISGAVDIEAEHSDVTVSRAASLTVVTSFDDVTAADIQGPVRITNEHGAITVRLPVGPRYAIAPNVEHGRVRIDDAFQGMETGDQGAIPVTLDTTYDDIVVKPGGSRSKGVAPQRMGEES
jgi:hypothetical protein